MELVPAKNLVTKNKSSAWFGTDYNMNIYRGCCHGCIYCDSRSECYHIDNFGTVRAKDNALAIIRDDLRRKVPKGVICTGAMSDPYNPFEKEYKLTRNALELINAFGFGVAIATKSALVVRDADVLSDIKSHSPVIVKITVTAADDELSRKVERNVNVSSKRFEAMSQLAEKGIYTGTLLMPVLPFIEDNEENVLHIVRKTYESGGKFIYAGFGMTARQNQREWYFDRLDEDFPGIKEKHIKRYGSNYNCVSPYAKKLWGIFAAECDKYGILYQMKDIVRAYKTGYEYSQLSLF